MPAPKRSSGAQVVRAFFWDLLTFDKMLTGPVIHLIYWSGLGLIVLGGFSIVGGAIGLGIRGGSIAGYALAFATLVGGLLVLAAMILIWRGFNEFYLAVFSIAEDLRAIRVAGGVDVMGRAGETAFRDAPPPATVESAGLEL